MPQNQTAFGQNKRMKLTEYSFNKYSQFGEDGIINKIFDVITPRSSACVEFGAWDGFHCSNTAHLWTNGWNGILIEGDAKRFDQLVKNVTPYNCTAISRYVGIKKGNLLEEILQENKIDFDIDLLSIDIDGDDYHILASLSSLRPRVIICEYNHTIPYWMDIYQQPGEYFGASVAALVRLAKAKGYQLIAITDGSCIFIEGKEYKKFDEFNTNLNDIANNKYLNTVITDYGGKYMIHGRFPFGIDKKHSMASLALCSGTDSFKSNLSICNTGNVKAALKSLYYGLMKPMLNKQQAACLKKK
jgi:hypothetical protein